MQEGNYSTLYNHPPQPSRCSIDIFQSAMSLTENALTKGDAINIEMRPSQEVTHKNLHSFGSDTYVFNATMIQEPTVSKIYVPNQHQQLKYTHKNYIQSDIDSIP